MKVEYFIPTKLEYFEIINYYNEQSEGLGFEFAVEIESTIERIKILPHAWPCLSKQARRCRTKRFPYGIIYYSKEDTIYIVGIMHLNRDPKKWIDRLKDELHEI
jgi:hypothetical protein